VEEGDKESTVGTSASPWVCQQTLSGKTSLPSSLHSISIYASTTISMPPRQIIIGI
jgi:hypothetical protein